MLSRSLSRFSCVKRLIAPNISRLVTEKSLHVTASGCAKKYQHVEADFIYKYVSNYESLQGNEGKSIQTFKLQDNYDGKTTDELVKEFEALSYHCAETETCMSDECYTNLFVAMVAKAPAFSDDQLIAVLQHLARFPATPNTHSKNFHELWTALDDTCCDRSYKNWKFPMILRVCNLWYKLNLSRIGAFTGRGITKIARRIDRLSPSDLVETMFYLTVCRKKIPMIEVQSSFLNCIDRLTIDEIGIMCLAFFKTESKISLIELSAKIYERTSKEIDDIQDITLANILKTLRYSSIPTDSDMMEKLSDVLVPKVESSSLMACLHIILLGTNLQYCHQQLIEAVVRKFNQNLKSTRLKDIERICFALALFNFKTESGIEKELLHKIIDELKSRVDEITRFPKCLSSTVHFLAVCGVYDFEIFRSVLKESFINFAYGTDAFKIGREILCIDSYTRINLKSSYVGPQLTPRKRHLITKFQTHYVPYRGQKFKLTHSDLLILDVKEFMERQFGENALVHVLPHFQRPDIVYCFDKNGKSVTKELLDCFPPLYNGDILFKESLLSKRPEMADKMDSYQMFAVVMGGWNLYLRDTDKETGEFQMKIDQLKMIGYSPIVIHWVDWRRMNLMAKEQFFDEQIKKALSK